MTGELLEYASLLDEIKGRIRQAQTRAVSSANREMLALYWEVGRLIRSRQEIEGLGAGVLRWLATDLKNDLPGYSCPVLIQIESNRQGTQKGSSKNGSS